MWRKMWRHIILVLLCGAMTLVFAGGGYITPAAEYSSARGKTLGGKYAALLQKAVGELKSQYSSSELRLVTLDESMVGGAGFWKNPDKFGTDSRYMGLLVMTKTPPYIFGDNRNGHVASVLDRYGKSMITALTKQMQAVGPPGVDGIALCIIWGPSTGGNPVDAGSEAMALFLARQDVIQYKNFKLTIENLVNRNELFLFNGSEEIDNLLQFILEP